MDSENLTIYIISVLCLGAVLIMARDRVPQQLKRGMALTTVIMILLAFVLIIYTFLA